MSTASRAERQKSPTMAVISKPLKSTAPTIPASSAGSPAITAGSKSMPIEVKKIATNASRSGSSSANTWCA